MKRTLITATAIACLLPSALPVFANNANNEASVDLNGTIEAAIIDFTVPTDIEFTINPNATDKVFFVSPDFEIINESAFPLNLSVLNFEQAADSTHVFTDVMPDTHTDWSLLTKAETERDFALGIIPTTPDQWLGDLANDTVWAKTVQDDQSGSGILIGSIPAKGTVDLRLTAHHGLSFANALTTKYQATLLFDLLP